MERVSGGRGPNFFLADLSAGTYPLAEAKGGTVVSRHRRQLCSSSGMRGVAERTSEHTHTHTVRARSPGELLLLPAGSFLYHEPKASPPDTNTHTHARTHSAKQCAAVPFCQACAARTHTHPHQKKVTLAEKKKDLFLPEVDEPTRADFTRSWTGSVDSR